MKNRNHQIGKPGRSAFTALEVVLAIIILSMALVPTLGTMADTGREAGYSEAYLLAEARIQALLDAVEAAGWITLPAGVDSAAIAIPNSAGDPPATLQGVDPQGYQESLSVERLEDGLIMVRARLQWSPMLKRGHRETKLGSFRVLRRPDGSWTKSLKLTGGSEA